MSGTSLGGLKLSVNMRAGDAERCLLVGIFGGEESSRVLRLFK